MSESLQGRLAYIRCRKFSKAAFTPGNMLPGNMQHVAWCKRGLMYSLHHVIAVITDMVMD